MTNPLELAQELERLERFCLTVPVPPNAITWEHGNTILDELQEHVVADIRKLTAALRAQPQSQTENGVRPQLTLDCIIKYDSGFLTAQCLQKDIGAQGKTLEELLVRLRCTVAAEAVVALDLGEEPFAAIDPAPKEFWIEAGKEYTEKQKTFSSAPQPLGEREALLRSCYSLLYRANKDRDFYADRHKAELVTLLADLQSALKFEPRK